MNIVDDIAEHRKDIATDTYTVTWRELIGQYKDQELIISPEYQRLFRWDIYQQTQYIESILLSIPSPPLFLAQNPKDGKFEVIDGLQRISTLFKFFSNEIFETEVIDVARQQPEPEKIQNDIHIPTRLAAGPILGSLKDFTALTLPETVSRSIKYARVTIILLEKQSSFDARYEVFRRLNKQGSILSDQEIRNCTARLLGEDFPKRLRVVADKLNIRTALSLSEKAELSMGVEEMLLRLLALNYSSDPLQHKISDYLDAFMKYAAQGKFTITESIESMIDRAFSLLQEALPNGAAFKFPNSGFSTNLYDVVATGVFYNVDKLDVKTIRAKHKKLMASDELKGVTGAGSNTRRKLEGRIELGRKWFAR